MKTKKYTVTVLNLNGKTKKFLNRTHKDIEIILLNLLIRSENKFESIIIKENK